MRIILILTIFLLSLLQTPVLGAQQGSITCEQFKTGKFTTLYGVKVTRKAKTQKEIWTDSKGKKHKITYKIQWIDDCSYKLKLVKTNDNAIRKEFKDHRSAMYIEIIDLEANGYRTKARWVDETTWRYSSKLVRVIPKEQNNISPTDDIEIKN